MAHNQKIVVNIIIYIRITKAPNYKRKNVLMFFIFSAYFCFEQMFNVRFSLNFE